MNNGGPSRDEREDEARESALPLEDVSRLVELVRESGVGELSVRQGEFEVTVRARLEPAAAPTVQTQPLAQPAPVQTQQPAQAVAPDSEERGGEAASENGNGDLHEVRSPLVGTFYRAPAPGEDDYVQVGDRVREGQTLCIVEAMKLMNEIPADVSGEVVEVLAENAGGVQYDQPLFALQPD